MSKKKTRPTRAEAITIAESLTEAQRIVFDGILAGLSANKIAKARKRSIHTINNQTREIFRTFHATSRSEVMSFFIEPPSPVKLNKI